MTQIDHSPDSYLCIITAPGRVTLTTCDGQSVTILRMTPDQADQLASALNTATDAAGKDKTDG
jgi:hypothetical protein